MNLLRFRIGFECHAPKSLPSDVRRVSAVRLTDEAYTQKSETLLADELRKMQAGRRGRRPPTYKLT